MTDPDPDVAAAAPGFTHVLAVLVLDDDGAVDAGTLAAADGLARANGARLSVLFADEPPAELARMGRATGLSAAEMEDRIRADDTARARAAVFAAGLGADIDVAVRIGKPFLEIIRHADAIGADLVIKPAEELHGIHRYLFASTDQHLLRKCPCPVWLRLADGPTQARTVVAAVDIDADAAAEPETLAGLNHRILETAAAIAAGAEATVHVLHVWDAPGEGLVRTWTAAPDRAKAVENYVMDVQATHWQALHDLVESARRAFGGGETPVSFLPRLERGHPRDAIPAEARGLGADVLVMGTIARTGVPGFIIGNTAEDVLNGCECSVATVKPPGYRSPVLADDG